MSSVMSKPPRIRLEGWLLKKKSKEKSSVLFKGENQRWFRIQDVEVCCTEDCQKYFVFVLVGF
jgi:hypothetical protein